MNRINTTVKDAPEGLTIRPYAVQTYRKASGEKRYVTLIYRREVRSLTASVEFTQRVFNDIAEAGAMFEGRVTITLTPERGGKAFRCLLEIPLEAG